MTAPDRTLGMGVRRSLAPSQRGLPKSLLAALFGCVVVVALGFSVLRSQIIELRYRAAEVVQEERALEERRRNLAVQVRQLRDPARLAERAQELGFGRPEHVVDLHPRRGPGPR